MYIYIVGMAPLMMHHAYGNYGGGGNSMQQMQLHVQQQQQLHLQHHQIPSLWNNHGIPKRSNYYQYQKKPVLKNGVMSFENLIISQKWVFFKSRVTVRFFYSYLKFFFFFHIIPQYSSRVLKKLNVQIKVRCLKKKSFKLKEVINLFEHHQNPTSPNPNHKHI